MSKINFLGSILFLFSVDQLTKYFSIFLNPVYLGLGLGLKYSKNYGISLNLLGPGIVMKIGIFLALIYFVYIFWEGDFKLDIAWALIVAGVLGNLTDRLLWGYVIDFIFFKPGNFIFNLADFFIFLGFFIHKI